MSSIRRSIKRGIQRLEKYIARTTAERRVQERVRVSSTKVQADAKRRREAAMKRVEEMKAKRERAERKELRKQTSELRRAGIQERELEGVRGLVYGTGSEPRGLAGIEETR